MATLYKERPGGAFISTALLTLWQHRRLVVLRIWAVSILLVGIATWLEQSTIGIALSTLWMWWSVSEQILADDQAGAEALREIARKRAESDRLFEKTPPFSSESREVFIPSRFSLPGFRHLHPLRMLVSALPLVAWLFISEDENFVTHIWLLVLCPMAPLLLVLRALPGRSLLGMVPMLFTNSILPGLSVLFCFGIWWLTIGASGTLMAVFDVWKSISDFLPNSYLETIHNALSQRVVETLTTMGAYGLLLIQGTLVVSIFTYLLGHVVDCSDHRGLNRRLDTF